jgi:GxxExxY protein
MERLTLEDDPVTERVIECAIDVHRELGPGLLERPYLVAMGIALKDAGLDFEMEKRFPIVFRGRQIGEYIPDLIVANHAVIDIKSVERYDPVFLAQMLTYLRITNLRIGVIVNFNRPRLIDGIKRVIL